MSELLIYYWHILCETLLWKTTIGFLELLFYVGYRDIVESTSVPHWPLSVNSMYASMPSQEISQKSQHAGITLKTKSLSVPFSKHDLLQTIRHTERVIVHFYVGVCMHARVCMWGEGMYFDWEPWEKKKDCNTTAYMAFAQHLHAHSFRPRSQEKTRRKKGKHSKSILALWWKQSYHSCRHTQNNEHEACEWTSTMPFQILHL